MLSKVAKHALRAAFSKISTTNSPTSSVASQVGAQTASSKLEIQKESSASLQQVKDISSVQHLHFNDYLSEVKLQVANEISINFEDLTHQEVLLLDSPVGQNNWKLAELITLGGAFKFVGLLAGFPSYAALVGALGVTGIGAALSYSNYLRRSTPQITQIKLTKDGRLHVFYLKPGFIGREESDFEVSGKGLSFVSFGDEYINFLRKSNSTSWVSVQGNLFWYNNDQSSVRINSHLYEKFF